MKKIIIIAVVAALAAGGFYYWQQQQSGKLPENIAQSNGRLELNRIDVASLYGGRVEKMNVAEGDDVKAGDVLAELSSDTSSSRLAEAQAAARRQQEAVTRAQAAKVQTQQSVVRAQANVAAAHQQQRVAKLEWDNARKLLADQLVSRSEVTKRQADYERAVAAVKAAEAARDEAQAVVAQAEAQVKSATSANDDMNIRAPINGRVEYKIAEVGNVIAAGNKIVSLLDPTDVSMNIFLPTDSMSRLKVGDEARIKLDGIDAVFPATIQFIATDAQFTPKSVETESERAKLMFKVKLQVPSETATRYNRLLKGGLTGNGFVKTQEGEWPSELAVKLPQ